VDMISIVISSDSLGY